MELHRVISISNRCHGWLVCHRKGVCKMVRTIIVCLISYWVGYCIGYCTKPYNPFEADKEEKMFQLIALFAGIATVITIALM